MKNLLRLLVGAVSASFIALASQAAELAPAAFSAGSVTGDVSFKVPGSNEYQPLAAGAALPQGATIKTGAGSRAVIVFGSGSTAAVSPNSEVEITKFEQALFSGPVPVDSEPAVSNTEIRVIEGGVVSRVAKLKQGSNYAVNTPVGAAGVRGTVFYVYFNAATQQLIVATSEGSVVFSNNGNPPATIGAGFELIGKLEVLANGDLVLRTTNIGVISAASLEEIEGSVAPVDNTGRIRTLTIVPVDTTQLGVSPN